MSHRRGKEFSERTKQIILYRSKGKCEVSGEPLKPGYEFHHLLPLHWAALHAPDIDPTILKSPKNGRVVNGEVHKRTPELHNDDEIFELYAQQLRLLQVGLPIDL